jgi:Zn-dependent protease with chaperone function
LIEATFPLLGTAFVVLFALPAFALLVKAGLLVLERDEVGGPLHGLSVRFVLLTGSSVLPLAWFVSAGLYQSKTAESALACVFDHGAAELCLEPGFFALALIISVLLSALRLVPRHQRLRSSSSNAARALLDRIENIVATRPALAGLRQRLAVTDDARLTLGTHGLFKPRVFISTAFGSRVSDEMLASALGHEAEHVRDLDPLRYTILQFALAVNPFGRFLLAPHAARWQAAREAHCDREAVIHGAAPLPLADAIVRAARPDARESVALGARDTAVLKFRIGMLLAFAERAPSRCCRQGAWTFPVALLLLMLVLLLPHQAGAAALDVLHTSAEHALTRLWR